MRRIDVVDQQSKLGLGYDDRAVPPSVGRSRGPKAAIGHTSSRCCDAIPTRDTEVMMQPIVEALSRLIRKNEWQTRFRDALKSANKGDVSAVRGVETLDDYLRYLDALVTWTPREQGDSRLIYDKLAEFYYFLDQEPVKSLKSARVPAETTPRLSPLSAWIVEFAEAWGAYLDTVDSAKEIESFRTSPLFNWDEYMPPPSGYFTFNQFFARHARPGMRPIAGLRDDSIIVAPADSTYIGRWQVDERSKIHVSKGHLDIKGLQWSIHQLLEGSKHADSFRGGIFTHSFLNTFDYHRWHAPVQGKVLEARVIQGQAFVDVSARLAMVDGMKMNILKSVDGTGYQFVQTRGLVVLDSPIGLVACLPIGMGQVSSVALTAEVGATLHKGEELGYFQFGGSDFVMVFERSSNVQLTSHPGVHYQQGTCVGNAHPYAMK